MAMARNVVSTAICSEVSVVSNADDVGASAYQAPYRKRIFIPTPKACTWGTSTGRGVSHGVDPRITTWTRERSHQLFARRGETTAGNAGKFASGRAFVAGHDRLMATGDGRFSEEASNGFCLWCPGIHDGRARLRVRGTAESILKTSSRLRMRTAGDHVIFGPRGRERPPNGLCPVTRGVGGGAESFESAARRSRFLR
jgi:hypothetical protein